MRITKATLAVAACAICSIGATAAAQASNGDEVLICHGTASETNPYVLISVSENAAATHLDGHGENNHPDYLLPEGQTDCSGGPSLEVAGE